MRTKTKPCIESGTRVFRDYVTGADKAWCGNCGGIVPTTGTYFSDEGIRYAEHRMARKTYPQPVR